MKAFLIAVICLSLSGTTFAFSPTDFDGLMTNIFTDCLGLLWSVVKMAALFMIITVVILYYCCKKRLFKRQNPLWDKLTYLYYVLFPICMLFVSVIVAVPSHISNMAEKLVMQGVVPVMNGAITQVVENLPPNMSGLLRKSPEEYFANAISDALKDPSWVGKRGGFAANVWNSMVDSIEPWFVRKAASMIVAEITGGKAKTVEEALKTFHKQQLTKSVLIVADQLGVWATTTINSTIHGYQRSLLLILGSISLIPLFDILMAFGPGRRQEGPGQA